MDADSIDIEHTDNEHESDVSIHSSDEEGPDKFICDSCDTGCGLMCGSTDFLDLYDPTVKWIDQGIYDWLVMCIDSGIFCNMCDELAQLYCIGDIYSNTTSDIESECTSSGSETEGV